MAVVGSPSASARMVRSGTSARRPLVLQAGEQRGDQRRRRDEQDLAGPPADPDRLARQRDEVEQHQCDAPGRRPRAARVHAARGDQAGDGEREDGTGGEGDGRERGSRGAWRETEGDDPGCALEGAVEEAPARAPASAGTTAVAYAAIAGSGRSLRTNADQSAVRP